MLDAALPRRVGEPGQDPFPAGRKGWGKGTVTGSDGQPFPAGRKGHVAAGGGGGAGRHLGPAFPGKSQSSSSKISDASS